MSRLLVKHLISKGAKKIAIVNRSRDRAAAMLKEFEASGAEFDIRPLDQMFDCIAISDLVFTSTASTEVILSRKNLEAIATNHSGLTLVDISVPRNISSDAKELPNTQAYNVDDLQAVVAGNQESRRQMAMQAEILLEGCVAEFDSWWRSLETVPTISKLRQKMEIIREQEMEKALSRLGNDFADKHQDVIESMTRGIINKILHDPMVQLRAQQDIETRRRAMQMLQVLFDLDAPSGQLKEG
jgi:glutamyl-tRNA reductase